MHDRVGAFVRAARANPERLPVGPADVRTRRRAPCRAGVPWSIGGGLAGGAQRSPDPPTDLPGPRLAGNLAACPLAPSGGGGAPRGARDDVGVPGAQVQRERQRRRQKVANADSRAVSSTLVLGLSCARSGGTGLV